MTAVFVNKTCCQGTKNNCREGDTRQAEPFGEDKLFNMTYLFWSFWHVHKQRAVTAPKESLEIHFCHPRLETEERNVSRRSFIMLLSNERDWLLSIWLWGVFYEKICQRSISLDLKYVNGTITFYLRPLYCGSPSIALNIYNYENWTASSFIWPTNGSRRLIPIAIL